jgi:hypothetical protein
MLAELVKQRFKVVEIPRYDINESPFIDACKEAGIFAAVQGYLQEGSDLEKMEYPLVSICEDIRKLEKLIPAIKKKYNDISLVKDFNEKRKKTKIDNITSDKLKRILRNVDTTKGVNLVAGDKFYTLTPEKIKRLIKNVDSFFVEDKTVEGSDKIIIQEIIKLNHITLLPFEKKKDKNQGGFFKHYNTTNRNQKSFHTKLQYIKHVQDILFPTNQAS